jgi:16S rRNA (cytidine1402-2'-O)-methyltransferase
MAKLWILEGWNVDWSRVTLRIARVLHEASFIAAMDGEVLDRLRQQDLAAHIIPFKEGDPARAADVLWDALCQGDGAWVWTDIVARSPSGWAVLRALVERGIEIVSVPGPSTAIAALVVSGLPTTRFTYLGALPGNAQARRVILDRAAAEPYTWVVQIQDCPLSEAIADMHLLLGDRHIAIYQEERAWRGSLDQAQDIADLGPCTIVVQGQEQPRAWTEDKVRARVSELLASGRTLRDISHEVAADAGWARRQVYEIALLVRGKGV